MMSNDSSFMTYASMLKFLMQTCLRSFVLDGLITVFLSLTLGYKASYVSSRSPNQRLKGMVFLLYFPEFYTSLYIENSNIMAE